MTFKFYRQNLCGPFRSKAATRKFIFKLESQEDKWVLQAKECQKVLYPRDVRTEILLVQ